MSRYLAIIGAVTGVIALCISAWTLVRARHAVGVEASLDDAPAPNIDVVIRNIGGTLTELVDLQLQIYKRQFGLRLCSDTYTIAWHLLPSDHSGSIMTKHHVDARVMAGTPSVGLDHHGIGVTEAIHATHDEDSPRMRVIAFTGTGCHYRSKRFTWHINPPPVRPQHLA